MILDPIQYGWLVSVTDKDIVKESSGQQIVAEYKARLDRRPAASHQVSQSDEGLVEHKRDCCGVTSRLKSAQEKFSGKERIMTAIAELARDTERDYEIINGKSEVKMAGARHGRVGARLIGKLVTFVEEQELGGIYTPDTTFIIGNNERLPDISFVSAARMPEEGDPEGIWRIAPDLAVEVVSPNDLWEKVEEKVADYFAAGVREVWVVSLKLRRVYVYHSFTKVSILTEDDQLTSPALLPGFSCRVGDLFGKSPASKQADAPDEATV
jgi:Uma2 family endonuclease